MSIMLEKGEAARALRSEGLLYREIAERLDISISYVEQLLNDPDGSKARARKMQGVCEDCGKAICSDGPSNNPQRRCSSCQHAYQKANAKWTRETIIAAIRRWHSLYGQAPAASSWNTTQAKPEDRERFRAGDYPPLSTVQGVFGMFSKAILAAGFVPRHKNAGKPRKRISEAEYRQMERWKAQGLTYQQIADRLGITVWACRERMRRRRHKMPTSLKAETVLEREIARFEDRKARAEADAKDAAEQVERLKIALATLTNGSPKP